MNETASLRINLYSLAAWTAVLLLAYCLATMIFLIVIGGMPETAQAGFDILADNHRAALSDLVSLAGTEFL